MNMIQPVYINTQSKSMRSHMDWLRTSLLFLILFGIEFDVDIYGPISLRKVSFLLLLLLVFYKGIPKKLPITKSHFVFIGTAAIMYGYAAVSHSLNAENIAVMGNSVLSPTQILFQFLSFFVFPILLCQVFRDFDDFCTLQLNVILFQAVVAIISRLYKPFRMYIYHHFNTDPNGNFLGGVESGIRVCYIGSFGATASWILFIGCLLCVYHVITKRRAFYLVLYAIIMLAMMFVGRTGLYMALLLLAFLFFYSMQGHAYLMRALLLAGICGVFVVVSYILFVPDSYLKRRTIEWVGEIFIEGAGQGSTVAALINMGIPPLTWETLWGTGILTGVTKSGLSAYSDVGYIQHYMSYGLVGASLYYGWTYGFFAQEICKVQDKTAKMVLSLFLFFIAFVELKEPFLRKTPNAMVLVTMIFIQLRCQRKELLQKDG